MNSSSGSTDAPVRLDRRTARRLETKAEIVAAGWDLVRENGLAGLAMRDLGERVGMKAQSIYSYFGSKHEIYDAMFHEGYVAFAASAGELFEDPDTKPLDRARAMAHGFFHFCTSDPVRYQLLFQRTIPEFVPSEESFAVAIGAYESMTSWLTDLGITDPAAVDLWTAVLTGLTDQQISNDPGGDRWEGLIDRTVEMTLREIAPQLFETPNGK
jgi:AcrR family transcriptional regulator